MHIFRNNPSFFLQILLHLRKGIPQGATPGPFYSLRHKQHIPPQASCSAFITICQAAYRHLQCFLHRHQPLKSYFLCPKLCSSFNPCWWSCPGISASFSLTPKSSISQSPIDLTSRKPLKSVHCLSWRECCPFYGGNTFRIKKASLSLWTPHIFSFFLLKDFALLVSSPCYWLLKTEMKYTHFSPKLTEKSLPFAN